MWVLQLSRAARALHGPLMDQTTARDCKEYQKDFSKTPLHRGMPSFLLGDFIAHTRENKA